jgi:hypothetical protein
VIGDIIVRRVLAGVAAILAVVGVAACSASTSPSEQPSTGHSGPTEPVSPTLARQLADAHAATAKYATDLAAAQRDGYMLITPMMEGMGLHYLNPAVEGFDPTRPPILVYVMDGDAARLVALEWVFPETPATPPLEGATYGSFDSACHFKDGTFVVWGGEADCPAASADGSEFTFWHPDLVTLHVWLWLHNPAGIYHPTNPLVVPQG